MIGFFPTPYPDELLYSVISRYQMRSGNIYTKTTNMELFNKMLVSAITNLPCDISKLINNMPINSPFKEEEFIYKHTLYRYYTAFLPSTRADKIFQSMLSNDGGNINMSAGIMSSTIKPPSHFQFCPQCLREDIEKYGEPYWHTIHQIPGVMICSAHKILLQSSLVPVDNENKYIFATEENCIIRSSTIKYSEDTIQKLYLLAKDIEYLMNNNLPRRENEWFRQQYIAKLVDKDLAILSGKIRQKDLIQDFTNFYGSEFLSLTQSDIRYDGEHEDWLIALLRKSEKSAHPIRYLLISRYLDISLEELFEKKYENQPFGRGPWICLNAAAEHYMQPVVKDLKISFDCKSKKTIGTFTCSCGFVHSRSGPDLVEEDKYKKGLIKAYGPVWENKLKLLVSEGKYSLRQLAQQLNVSRNTVKKYSKQMGLNQYWNSSENTDKIEEEDCSVITTDFTEEVSLQEKYRNRWLEVQKEYPEKCKSELRELCETGYIWLYRHDNDWLSNNSPNYKPFKANNRVDWEERDNEILYKAKEAVEEILSSKEKPVRISIGRIGKKIGKQVFLEKCRNKIPKTEAYLESVAENVADFQVRRIKWVIAELEKEGKVIKAWDVIRKAGISEKYANGHLEFINDEIRKIKGIV